MLRHTATRIGAALLLVLSFVPTARAHGERGSFQRYHRSAEQLLPLDSSLKILASGFRWSEGPVWVEQGGYLLFTDVPNNRILRWTSREGLTTFLYPSGGTVTEGFREPGANGLKPDGPEHVILADQGNRAIARLNLATKDKRFIAQSYKGKRFNSPNDLAISADGSIWFTDPPYGLEGVDGSPLKEQPVNGVYQIRPDGTIRLVESGLRYPNGVAFSPDAKTLYISNSDPEQPIILAYDVARNGTLSRRRTFADMSALAKKGLPGLPDGMAVDERGNLWATGPGGIHILSPSGLALGLISTGAAVSNCTFGGTDGRTLFLTSSKDVMSVRTGVRGAKRRVSTLQK